MVRVTWSGQDLGCVVKGCRTCDWRNRLCAQNFEKLKELRHVGGALYANLNNCKTSYTFAVDACSRWSAQKLEKLEEGLHFVLPYQTYGHGSWHRQSIACTENGGFEGGAALCTNSVWLELVHAKKTVTSVIDAFKYYCHRWWWRTHSTMWHRKWRSWRSGRTLHRSVKCREVKTEGGAALCTNSIVEKVKERPHFASKR